MLHVKSPFTSAITTIDVRRSNVDEADVAMTIETHGDRITILLSTDQANALIYDLTRAVDAAGKPRR